MKTQNYNVHKFGGTSLADASRFVAVKSLLSGKNEIIVVSAIKDTTTTLQTLLDVAKSKRSFNEALKQLEQLHLTLVNELLPEKKHRDIISIIQKDFAEIKEILHVVSLTGSYAKETQDLILGYGETWSAKILTEYLAENHNVVYLDATTVLFMYEKNGMIGIDWEKSQVALDRFLENKKFDQLVITGFIAATLDGKRTTLGRNGSDFSAGIFANLFQAKCLYIWSDVDGIYTADPERVRSAFVIDNLSYKEALELAYFGAKVLHPMTIAPLLAKKIPLYIKNSFNPEAKGTYISATPQKSPYIVKGLTCISDIALINIEGTGIIGVSGISAQVFQVLHQACIPVILISQASSEYSLCFAVPNQYADAAVKVLNDNLHFEIDKQQIEAIHVDKTCAILAAVGEGMVGAIGISAKLCATLAKANINIRAVSQGSSERNISIVIKDEDANKALQAVHAGFYLSHKSISIGLIGPGHVGSTLLKQIYDALGFLKEKYQVNLCVRGIMSSKKMLLHQEPIDLAIWREKFDKKSIAANLPDFVKHILADDVPHAVIIDCTASSLVSEHYIDFLNAGINVITPNKFAGAGDLLYYKQIKTLAQQKNCYYLYEATVCAGLPVITTLQDIIKTGDRVETIQGVVSGTLSFIFNELAAGKTFSSAVLTAKERGYTEPDPREDLSGQDVARKLVCLAREMGFDVSLSDVKVHDLVPAPLKSCSTEEFLRKLPDYDHQITDHLQKANAKGERLFYVGAIHEDGTLHVAIDSFPSTHPFTRLKGTDNMLIFHTRRYHEHPLIIQGPGAGSEVAAAGVFADLLRLVSFLS